MSESTLGGDFFQRSKGTLRPTSELRNEVEHERLCR